MLRNLKWRENKRSFPHLKEISHSLQYFLTLPVVVTHFPLNRPHKQWQLLPRNALSFNFSSNNVLITYCNSFHKNVLLRKFYWIFFIFFLSGQLHFWYYRGSLGAFSTKWKIQVNKNFIYFRQIVHSQEYRNIQNNSAFLWMCSHSKNLIFY